MLYTTGVLNLKCCDKLHSSAAAVTEMRSVKSVRREEYNSIAVDHPLARTHDGVTSTPNLIFISDKTKTK